jgi:hypothetical protein
MRQFALVLSLLTGMVLASPGRANADWPWHFARITCVPELGYFSIRKLVILNLPKMGPYLTEGDTPSPGVVRALQDKYGIFDSVALSAHPVTCTIPHLDAVPGWEQERPGFEVRIVGHWDKERNDQVSSYCMMVDNAEVLVNGKSIGSILLNPCENGLTLLSVEVYHSGVELSIRTCSHDLTDHNVDQEQVICREAATAGAH